MSPKRLFILDTNVLLVDPHAIYAFEDNDVIIPIPVIEEIDAMKSRNDSVGFNARLTSRLLDGLRQQGRLDEGVLLETGGILKIEIDKNGYYIPEGLAEDRMDNRILKVAFIEKDNNQSKYAKITLVSRDINMRIKANAFGLEAEDYIKDRIEYKNFYTGIVELELTAEIIDNFYQEGFIKIVGHDFYPNECVHLSSGTQSALGIYRADTDALRI